MAEHGHALRESSLDLSVPRRLHIVGVGGVGMSALALLLARMGHDVSGSDTHDPAMRKRLEEAAAGVEHDDYDAHEREPDPPPPVVVVRPEPEFRPTPTAAPVVRKPKLCSWCEREGRQAPTPNCAGCRAMQYIAG